jgi:hypothetical protein
MVRMILLASAMSCSLAAILSSSAEAQAPIGPGDGIPIGPSGGGGAPALQAKARVFSVARDEQGKPVMCEAGFFIHSVLATATTDNGIVPVTLVDAKMNPIPEGVWTPASGFKVTNPPGAKVNVILICGN